MTKVKGGDFGAEIAKMLPAMLRAVAGNMERVVRKGSLAVSHIVVLDALREKGACTMGELAGMLGLSMGAVTGIVDKMIKMGIVKRERAKEDRRVVNVEMLKKGKTLAYDINQMRKNVTNDLFSILTEAERVEYLRLIRKVYNRLAKK